MEPLRGRETLPRGKEQADERASPQDKSEGHPRVGAGPLLQQRDVLRGARLPRRRVHLRRAQRQAERHSALHLRDDRGPEDSRGRRVLRLQGVERAQLRRITIPRTWVNRGQRTREELEHSSSYHAPASRKLTP